MNTKTYAWAALGLSLIVPNTLVSGEYSYGSKEVYESTGVAMFEETPYTVDLYGGGSTVYNSNTTQQSDGTSAWVAIFDFGFDAIFYDTYRRNRNTGSFILIDPFTHQTLAAGMLR